MNILSTMTTLAWGLPALLASVSGAEPVSVYPRPQQCELSNTSARVESVRIERRQPESRGGLWEQLPEGKEGAYAIRIKAGKVLICANDEVGVFYARQTLIQLLQGVEGARSAQRDPFPDKTLEEIVKLGTLPEGTIVDWPDLPFRGTVEGYYGKPWSHEARKAQFDFYGRNKMNMYIYAPKDDPYHHGRGCYLPYPAEKAAEIAELVQHARRNHVRFVWAIHPANTVNWAVNGGKDQLDALCRKLQLMYDMGVRDFGVLVDDSTGEIGRPERQVQLCNYILENFIRRHPDVNQTLIMCPTGYNRSWTTPEFLRTLGEGLDKSIPVMWTGDTVVHDITLKGQRWVNELVNRPTFIWWNWPCSDFKRSRLSMGRTYGLGTEPDMKKEMSGFVANPMEQAEASKVGLFGVADYTWNITGFNSGENWRSGIRRLYPRNHEAMQTFCNHNSYLLPNYHGYYREESVEIAPAVSALVSSLAARQPDAAAVETVRQEFLRMAQAGEVLRQPEPELTALQQEIQPWIRQFTLTGRAGAEILLSWQNRGSEEGMNHFFDAVDIMGKMSSTSRMEWSFRGSRPVNDVETGMLTMTPALRSAFRYVNGLVYAELSGREAVAPVFTSNCGNARKDAALLSDGNPRTFWSSETRQKAGQWFCLDFGQPMDIRTVNLVMGGSRAQDYAEAGQFEVSQDGIRWKRVGEPMGGLTATLNLQKNPVRARMLRYRLTEPRTQWLSLCEFSVNQTLKPYVASNLTGAKPLLAFREDGTAGINRVMESFSLKPGEFIDLELPEPRELSKLEINLESSDLDQWARVELEMEDGESVILKGHFSQSLLHLEGKDLPEGKVSAVRLTHVGQEPREVKMTIFRVGFPAEDGELEPGSLVDGDFSTSWNCSRRELDLTLPVPRGATQVVVVGTADVAISPATPCGTSPHTRTFRLEPGARTIHLTAPRQEGKRVREVIFP